MGDPFNTWHMAKLLWAKGRNSARLLGPAMSQDPSSVIIPRDQLAVVPSLSFSLHRKITEAALDLKKYVTASSAAISLYACAATNFYSKEFYDSLLLGLLEDKDLGLKELGLISQSMVMMQKTKYNDFVASQLHKLVKDRGYTDYVHIDDEMGVVQTLMAVGFLWPEELDHYKPELGELIQHFDLDWKKGIERLLPSFLWVLTCSEDLR